MFIERDEKINALEQQLSSHLSKIVTELNLEPAKRVEKTNTVFVSVEDAMKELRELGVES